MEEALVLQAEVSQEDELACHNLLTSSSRGSICA